MMRLALACLLSLAAFAQDSGAITGKISDTFGEPVSGASIQARNAAGAVFKATSRATGAYAVDGLPAGAYELSIRMPRMKNYVRSSVAVRAGQPVRVDVTLQDNVQLGTLGDGDRFAQRRRPAPPVGPTPRMPGGKPDLSGFWAPAPADPSESEPPQGLPWVEAVVKERIANDLRDMPTARCLPNGVAATAGRGKFVQTPTLLVMLIEFPGDTRQVFLDGRAHPKELEPTWLGHSIGRWDGDTLVVDTVGFNDKSWLTMIRNPYPHTEMMHVVERYRRPDLGHLELEMTVEDTGAFQKPWVVKRTANLDPADEIRENICTENEKDLKHLPDK
ncbi:MAG TPA: carboxypeptidase-like regulatory domain-containing protein [Bryobacteraceae bacterium]|jgi:hypothetical protein